MRSEDLLGRLHVQSVRILALIGDIRPTIQSRSTLDQLSRCAPGARDNYRSACRGRSRKEWVSRLGVAVDEADETVGWLETMRDAGIGPRDQVMELLAEATELRAILAKSWSTSHRNLLDAKARRRPRRPPNR